MSNREEKLAGVDQALAELGKSDEEISEVRNRFTQPAAADLGAIDGALDALSEKVTLETAQREEPRAPESAGQSWDDENTEVEVVDESDFVLLVDEDDLEELEKAGEEDVANDAQPPTPPEGEEDEGFFKKLFGGRRTSNRP